MRSTRRALAIGLLAISLAAAACSVPSGSNADASAAATAHTAAASATEVAAAGAVSANTATHGELVTALEAAGVANADRWANEVMEYRPYDTADPSLQHLQDELAKYNPDDATLAAILSVLVP